MQAKLNGAQPIDKNGHPVPVARVAEYRDATETPQKSPLTINEEKAIAIPENAAVLVCKAVDADVKIGDATAFATGYISLGTSDGWFAIPVAGRDIIYVDAVSGTPVLHFFFEVM